MWQQALVFPTTSHPSALAVIFIATDTTKQDHHALLGVLLEVPSRLACRQIPWLPARIVFLENSEFSRRV